MRILVTGSAGHLGEALVRRLRHDGFEVAGADLHGSRFTDQVGSITDSKFVQRCLAGVDGVIHSATLHKPHSDSHSRHEFIETNVIGTLNLLEEAAAVGVGSFVFTSSTSAFGRALSPADGSPASWITEEVRPLPRNVYGVTKIAAEDLCELVHQNHGLPCLILRTSRFFPEPDDRDEMRTGFDDLNLKVNELLYRRIDLEDVVSAHLRALHCAPAIGFGRYVITATTPFRRNDVTELREDAPAVVRRLFPDFEAIYAERRWRMLPSIDRVYSNERARRDLTWSPCYDFRHVLDLLAAGNDPRSPLSLTIGKKGYKTGSSEYQL